MSTSRLVGAAGALTVVGVLAVAYVGGHEGLRLCPYRDPVNIPTQCFGETRGIKMTNACVTKADCERWLGNRLQEFEAGVAKCINQPERIPDKTWVSYISLSYNIGGAAFCRSTVARRANVGDLRGSCEAFMLWTRAGGRTLPGLVKRRKQERDLCLEGLKQ